MLNAWKRKLSSLRQDLRQDVQQGKASLQVQLRQFWAEELAKPRNREPKRLLGFGAKIYSQCDEDGIIAEIFRRIGHDRKTFVEFGVEVGIECNSLALLVDGWSGLWIEGNASSVGRMADTHRFWIEQDQLRVKHAFITAENINELIGEAVEGQDLDLLSVDIDFNDFWVWKAIDRIRPRVVVVEYNAAWAPPLSVVVPYNQNARWSGGNYSGASLEALVKLGSAKGYRIVGCNFSGVNAFFVREDLCGDHFLDPATAVEHYEPARYFFAHLQTGHPADIGPLLMVRSEDLLQVHPRADPVG